MLPNTSAFTQHYFALSAPQCLFDSVSSAWFRFSEDGEGVFGQRLVVSIRVISLWKCKVFPELASQYHALV